MILLMCFKTLERRPLVEMGKSVVIEEGCGIPNIFPLFTLLDR
jgi:hypothetical protein